MRNKVFQAQLNGMAFALVPRHMTALLEMANSEVARAVEPTASANNSVEYQEKGSVAVISIEGGMYKKDVGGLCSSVASYDQMVKAIDQAEANDTIKTILFRVDTGGGAVDGADEVGERIHASSKKTVTLYENMGASGGIWVFTPSDEVYATEATMLGSIGVVVSYMEDNEEEGKRIDIVSKNAKNKRCSLEGDCKEKIQVMLDGYEDIFYSRVMRNTGFTAEQIKTTFNSGDMIFAKDAEKAGFIKGITTFNALLKSLNTGSTIVPTASASESLISDDTNEKNTGADMTFDRTDLDKTEALFNTLVASKTTMDNRNTILTEELQEVTTALEASKETVQTLTADAVEHTTKLSEAEGNLANYKTQTIARLDEAVASGVSTKVAKAMVDADTDEEASSVALGADDTEALHQTDGGKKPDTWGSVVKKREVN